MTAKEQRDEQEASELLHDFCLNPTQFNLARRTCSRAVGAILIKRGLTLACGYGYYAKTKHLGCGVYHIFYERS